VFALVLAAAALVSAPAFAGDDAGAARGRALFVGQAALAARIVGQDFELPVVASRCINCHQTAPRSPASSALGGYGGPGGPSSAAPVAPTLTTATLAEPQRRRGGPPSRYDAATLCALLRHGVDPAHVMIQRTMPRYEISDADCRSLWQHLMQR
jgi:hypothetical protein